MPKARAILFFALCGWCLPSCSDDATAVECTSSSECGLGSRCVDGRCTPRQDAGPRHDADRMDGARETGTATDTGTGTDTGTATDTGTGTDTGTPTDTGTDTGAPTDTGTGTDTGTATGTDAGPGFDSGPRDAGMDAGMDAGSDAGRDAGLDAGCGSPSSIATPLPRHPLAGARTGSIHMAASDPDIRRPTFTWTSVPGATRYELEIDSSCAVGSIGACPFTSAHTQQSLPDTSYTPSSDLAASLVQPVGTVHAWRVRACIGACCSPWSTPRVVRVGRITHDANADGYSELFVGATGHDNGAVNEGNVFAFSGYGGGLDTTHSTLDSPTNQASASFGAALTSGDFNGDGYSDTVIGAPMEDRGATDEGNVYVIFGTASGPTGARVTLDDPGNVDDAHFGTAVATGDIDGDGLDDLVVGAPGQSTSSDDEGSAFVYFGTTSGIAPSATQLDNPDGDDNGYFGSAVIVGDFNGDGFGDVAVGAPGQSSPEDDEGSVYVFYGAASGLDTTSDLFLDNPADGVDDRFGNDLAAGDFNADGIADLVVAAAEWTTGPNEEGAFFVFTGSESGPADSPLRVENPDNTSGDHFATSLAACDLDGDGATDLIVGAPDMESGTLNEGGVFVYTGAAGVGITAAGRTFFDNPEPSTSDHFGQSVGCANFNGDSYADLVVGAPDMETGPASTDEGNILWYAGSASGPAPIAWMRIDHPATQADSNFGAAVTR